MPHLSFLAAMLLVFGCSNDQPPSSGISIAKPVPGDSSSRFQGKVVTPTTVLSANLADWANEGWNAVVIEVTDDTARAQVENAVNLLQKAEFEVGYYVEVARSPSLAEDHPDWMASLQGHDEWKRRFPNLKPLESEEVYKTWPWVPVVYQESYDAQLNRVTKMLEDLPRPAKIWLHDLQGGPSACGCGHPLCRWTGDYGPIHTAQPLPDNAAAQWIDDLSKRFPGVDLVPIWVTECEEEDEHEACGGVGCFEGICWKAWTRQLTPLAQKSSTIGVSCFYKEHERDLARYGDTATWIERAIGSFESMPATIEHEGISSERLIAVLQGWDMTSEELAAQLKAATNANAKGVLVVFPEQDQSWLPKPYAVPKSDESKKPSPELKR